MKCEAIQEQLLDYIDKKLSAEASQNITNHLLNCETCEKTYRRYQKTHEALKGFGEAVRAGVIDMDAPALLLLRRNPFWAKIWDRLKTPVPVWIPSAVSVAVLLMFAIGTFSPLKLSIEWGKEKGSRDTGSITPPLAAEAMLEFLIVPDPTDSGQLAASIEAVETFLMAHPEDLAMHAKLVELYQAQLKLLGLSSPKDVSKPSLSNASRAILEKKLSIERARFIELFATLTDAFGLRLEKTNMTKGAKNVEK